MHLQIVCSKFYVNCLSKNTFKKSVRYFQTLKISFNVVTNLIPFEWRKKKFQRIFLKMRFLSIRCTSFSEFIDPFPIKMSCNILSRASFYFSCIVFILFFIVKLFIKKAANYWYLDNNSHFIKHLTQTNILF